MENSLTQGNIAKSLFHFTVPLILSGMFQQVFNWVDAFIVRNAEGELALAGIGATTSIYNLFVTVMIGFTSGISVLTAQAFGMGEKERIQHILSAFSILLGGVFCVAAFFGISFAKEILMILDTPAVQAGTTSVGNIMLQRFMNAFGEQVVAAITTAYRVDSVIILPIINFGSGIATIVAQNIGAGKPIRAKKVLRTGSIMIAFISVGLTGLVIAAGETIIRMFGLTPKHFHGWYCSCFILSVF